MAPRLAWGQPPQSSGNLSIIQTINHADLAYPASAAIWRLFSIYVFWPRTKTKRSIVLYGRRPHGKAHIVNDQTTHTITDRQRIGRLDSRGHHSHVDGHSEMARP